MQPWSRHPATALVVCLALPLASAAPAAAAQLDHFTCYKARAANGARFPGISGVTLVDQFRSSTIDVRKPERLCAPTNKLGEDSSASQHPDHLEGYQIKPSVTFVGARGQRVVDQFNADLRLDLRKPAGLLVPTLKSLSGPAPTPASSAVDHFQCYKVARTNGAAKFVAVPGVTIEDQFGSMTVTVKKPRRLCLPVDKNNESPGAENHPDHLMCYQVKQTSLPRFAARGGINLHTQFGAETLVAKKAAELCVPALRNAPAGATATPTPGAGMTATAPPPTVTQTPTPSTPSTTPTPGGTPTPGAGATATASATPASTPIASCGAPPPSDTVLLPQDDPFYQPPNPIPAVPPGTVLRSRPVALAALSSSSTTPFSAWQVLYVSTDVSGQPSVVAATVIEPCAQAATTPRPLVSYQTAEDSDALICAPSYKMRQGTEKEEVSLPPLLANGWVVVVPDYEGLQSAYTAGIQAGHGVLDGIRAAENFSASNPDLGLGLTGVGTPVGLWGYSGGGLASSWASELAPTYAPELNIVGVSEGGVPPNITAVAKNIDGGPLSAIELAGVVGMSQAYPQLLTLLSAGPGAAMRSYFLSNCIEQYIASAYSFQRLDTYTTVPGAIDLEWVQAILADNHLGNVCSTSPFQPCTADGDCAGAGVCRRKQPTAPLYIYHAVNDELIPVADVNALVTQYCGEGVTVDYYQDPASDHNSLAVSGAPAAVEYLQARFAGQAVPITCGAPLLPPSPGVTPPAVTPTSTATPAPPPPMSPSATPTVPAPFSDCGIFPQCDGTCPAGQVCSVVFGNPTDVHNGGCACVTGTAACNGFSTMCAEGVCPPGDTCEVNPIDPPGGCGCAQTSAGTPSPTRTPTPTVTPAETRTPTPTVTPTGATPNPTPTVFFQDCGVFPTCGGACPSGKVCSIVFANPADPHDGGCSCVTGTVACGSATGGCQAGGACPPGDTCQVNPFGGQCGCFQTSP